MHGVDPVKRALILCTGNSCRSQMAEGLLQSFDASLEVLSAGTNPASRVHPMAVEVMREIGIDISKATPKSVEQVLRQRFDLVVTVCDHAKEACPVFVGSVRRRIHAGFQDPAEAAGSREEKLVVFRKVRDEIRETFRQVYDDLLRPDGQV
jgi:arsenate reductase